MSGRPAFLRFAVELMFCAPLLLSAHAVSSTPASAPPASSSPTDAPACGAPTNPAGATCGGEGPASQGNTSDTPQGAGNPINVITGNKYQREIDMAALPGVLGLELVRYYNSAFSGIDQPAGLLGRGWKLSYETRLERRGSVLQVLQADGTVLVFGRDLFRPGQFAPTQPNNGRIATRRHPGGTDYVWTWTNGRTLLFNEQGRLIQIQAPTGEFVSLRYDARGGLVRVTDPQGREMHLHTLDKPAIAANAVARAPQFTGVQTIDTPVGRFGYEYGSRPPSGSAVAGAALRANLVKVQLPTDYDSTTRAHAWTERGVSHSSISHLYHYEDARHPTLLTGISVQGQGSDGRTLLQRLTTWAYDAQGRARLSVKGEPARFVIDRQGMRQQVAGTGLEQVTLAWPRPGETVLTNSLGQRTVYRTATIAGENRILEVRGPGCASCGPGNVRYGYDGLGRLIEETALSQAGKPVKTVSMTRDALGRLTQIGTITWRNGTPQAPVWGTRYQYGDDAASDRPVLIARPSIVPGREHQVHIAYNDMGQVTRVTETGYLPLDAGDHPLDPADPEQARRATLLHRSTQFRYQTINGRSLLREIDGPLPNGPRHSPQDSDITRFGWDAKGNRIEKWIAPGGFETALAYDSGTGRILDVNDGEGQHTRYRYDARGQLIALSRAGDGWRQPQVQAFRHDALGNLTEAGTGADDAYAPQWRQAFDVSGNLLWRAHALGILEQQRYDTESHLLQTGRYSNRIADVHRLSYDAQNRLARIQDRSGHGIRFTYGEDGVDLVGDHASGRTPLPASVSDRERTRRGSLAPSRLPQQTKNDRVREWVDDFGRVVGVRSPDSGLTLRRFDEADRLVGSRDALGNQAAYVHDPAGRIVRQTIVESGSGQTVTTVWRYEGRRLIALDHPTQSERYRYDPRGLLIEKISRTTSVHGPALASLTRFTWDDVGRLTATTLPDGTTLRYVRNAQGQIVALQRHRLRTAWLQWLLPAQVIVEDIARDLVGLKQYTTGNGIRADFQRSRTGMLARVVYQRAPTSQQNAQGIADATPDARDPVRQGATASPGKTTGAHEPPQRLPGAIGLPPALQALLDERYLWDVRGNLLYRESKVRDGASERYAYDARSRLIAAIAKTGDIHDISRYAWDANDNRVLAQQGSASQADFTSGTHKTIYAPGTHRIDTSGAAASTRMDYDATGQPLFAGARETDWDAFGRLRTVRQGTAVLAQYVYNHRGERIAKLTRGQSTRYLYEDGKLVAELDATGQLRRQYLYLADQPIAVLDTPQGGMPASDAPSALTRIADDLLTVLRIWSGQDAPLVWLHANHLGAIEVASDSDGRAIWRARYTPFGGVMRISAGDAEKRAVPAFTLNLRLPGQYADSETGLTYNGHRYYDPRSGRYLTPDPLGAPDGPNPYLYVRGNPMRYVDPSGLVLIAFDGTSNSRQPPRGDSISNVVKFLEAYDENANGKKFYITGIGTTDENMPVKGNTWTGAGFDERVALGFKFLNDYIAESNANDILNIDVVGFSRGAAEARVWLNKLVGKLDRGAYTNEGKTRCLSLRFEGLWDTVPHLGLTNGDEAKYDFAIPAEVKYAAHAVALNEFRGNPANFNGRSIMNAASQPNSSTRVELGFIGSHSDIGGGYGTGDLSDVALVWMLDQAKKQGIVVREDEIEKKGWNVVTDPVLHDRSNNLSTPGKAPARGDREFVYVDGKSSVNMSEANVGGKTTADANADIRFYSDWCGTFANPVVGMVDMNKYAVWLKTYGVDIKYTPPVENSCGVEAA